MNKTNDKQISPLTRDTVFTMKDCSIVAASQVANLHSPLLISHSGAATFTLTESAASLSAPDITRAIAVSTPLYFSNTNLEDTAFAIFDNPNNQTTPSDAAKEYTQIEDSIWKLNNIYNWSNVLHRIKHFEGKYKLTSTELERAYRNKLLEVLNKIETQELREWMDLITVYY